MISSALPPLRPSRRCEKRRSGQRCGQPFGLQRILYLEKGKLPQTDSSWPLPEAGVTEKAEIRKRDFPMASELVDIAIAEKRIDDVLRWHDYQKSKKKGIWGWDNHQDESVAEAVADRYPDRALAIWKNLAERQIALTKPNAYETAAGYLRKVRELLKKAKERI